MKWIKYAQSIFNSDLTSEENIKFLIKNWKKLENASDIFSLEYTIDLINELYSKELDKSNLNSILDNLIISYQNILELIPIKSNKIYKWYEISSNIIIENISYLLDLSHDNEKISIEIKDKIKKLQKVKINIDNNYSIWDKEEDNNVIHSSIVAFNKFTPKLIESYYDSLKNKTNKNISSNIYMAKK